MITKMLSSLFGTKRDRQLKSIQPLVNEINKHFEHFRETLTDEQVPGITAEFRQRLKDGETVDDILPEAFGLVKDACRRMLGKRWEVVGNLIEWDMVPYDVQLIGAIVLHQGKIAEMATGEGKTLVATMPLYLNSLVGEGAHLVTVNDYLAQRDSEWNGGIFDFLGVSVGCILSEMTPSERRIAYSRDITYGTNNEFGFDYLRDNMATRIEDIVQRGHFYAIVDEVDSVLIDEARTPLIIAGPVSRSTQLYDQLKPSVEALVKAQRNRVNSLISEAEKLMESDSAEDQYEAGRIILKAQRSVPKHKRLMKLLSETGNKALMRQVEADYMRDKKLHELDEELLYVLDEKQHSIDLTEEGRTLLARHANLDADLFILPDLSEEGHNIEQREDLTDEDKAIEKDKLQATYAQRSEQIHNITQLLRAYSHYEKDIEYVIQDGKVMIVDEFTGRILPGRRYSDGLHQAIEAKEGVKVEGETQTVATITLQNYFRLYDKLAGMTGTAETEEGEFWDIYKLEVVVIPTNEPVRRDDHEDVIFKTKREKYNSIIDEIKELNEDSLPVLVGTTSVEVSETLSRMLRRQNIAHNVLNAKHHKNEADIVRYAGQPGAVTIATNMAGRGTDIKLGKGVIRYEGEDKTKAKAIGGLQIIGTERHESRRIDRQLRGRAGRQGDPGASIFYLSLEDDLMRLFGAERVANIMDRLGIKEGEVITHPMVTRSIEKAQQRVEAYNFSIRKHLLEYDDVMNQQREVVYKRRRAILFDEDIKRVIKEIIDEYVGFVLDEYGDDKSGPSNWDQDEIKRKLHRNMQINPPPEGEWDRLSKVEEWQSYLVEEGMKAYLRREELYGIELYNKFVRYFVLRTIDEKWKDHLYNMDRLKEGVGLRAYGQKDPLIEYKREGFEMFSDMLDETYEESLRIIFNSVIQQPQERQQARVPRLSFVHAEAGRPSASETEGSKSNDTQQSPSRGKKDPVRVEKAPGRNDPCPCGSGKKYKKCCGA